MTVSTEFTIKPQMKIWDAFKFGKSYTLLGYYCNTRSTCLQAKTVQGCTI